MQLWALPGCGSLRRAGIATLFEIGTYSRQPECISQVSDHSEDLKMPNHQAVQAEKINGITNVFGFL